MIGRCDWVRESFNQEIDDRFFFFVFLFSYALPLLNCLTDARNVSRTIVQLGGDEFGSGGYREVKGTFWTLTIGVLT